MENISNKSRKLNRIKKSVFLSAAILSLILLLGGCTPNNFTRAEKRSFLKTARGVASDLLEKQYSGAKIEDIQPETAHDGSGFVLTEFAGGSFSWQGRTYSFLVNTETEQVYTSVCLAEIKEGIKDAVLHGLGIKASEAVVDSIRINYLPIKDGVEDEGIYVDSSNVLPWRGSAEEHGLCLRDSEGFSPAIIPSLSEEIFKLNYRQGSPGNCSYTGNRVMERDGFYLVYNAYEDRYVYSDSTYIKAPHKFYDYFSMENIIYTKPASEEPPILPRTTEFEYIY